MVQVPLLSDPPKCRFDRRSRLKVLAEMSIRPQTEYGQENGKFFFKGPDGEVFGGYDEEVYARADALAIFTDLFKRQ